MNEHHLDQKVRTPTDDAVVLILTGLVITYPLGMLAYFVPVIGRYFLLGPFCLGPAMLGAGILVLLLSSHGLRRHPFALNSVVALHTLIGIGVFRFYKFPPNEHFGTGSMNDIMLSFMSALGTAFALNLLLVIGYLWIKDYQNRPPIVRDSGTAPSNVPRVEPEPDRVATMRE